MEHHVLPYTKDDIDSLVDRFGKKWSDLSKVIHCICIFMMPMIAKTPLSMLPLLALIFALMLIFYRGHFYTNILYIPETLVVIAALSYRLLKTKTFGLHTPVVNQFANVFVSFQETDSTKELSKIYIILCIMAFGFFKLYRYFGLIKEIARKKKSHNKQNRLIFPIMD